jgi:regulator of nucleoside diphosphate kinase
MVAANLQVSGRRARHGARFLFPEPPMSTERPAIVISTLDLDRLERLLESTEYARHPGADALRGEIERADVVKPQDMPADVVTMNSTLECVDEVSHETHRLTLVYPERADRDQGRISVLAPVGTALLGLRVGQEIEWPAPGGAKPLRLKVLSIDYQPEAAGELHR